MATWQPPIPAGALYSKAARALGPALPLLAYCYDKVGRDGSLRISLHEAASDMDEAYPTVKRWWAVLADGPFFKAIEKKGRNGMHLTFKDVWIDWRILKTRTDETFGTETGSEMIPNTPIELVNGITFGTYSGSEMIPDDQCNKVLITTDQADLFGALIAPPPAAAEMPKSEPTPRGKRDPNQQHPACLAFFAKTGYRPNRQQAADISATVIDLDQWQKAIAAWLGRGNRINDASGMLDWYLHPDRQTNTRSNGHGKQSIRQGTRSNFERANWKEGSIDDAI